MENKSIIEVEGVYIYQQKALILKEVNLKINKGELVYLIGRTGSGKSSLLKTLYADLHITQGKCVVAGHDLTTITDKKIPFLRRCLGIIFQDFQLLTDRTVHDNLLFVMKATGWEDPNKIENRIEEVLELVSLKTKGFKMPHELSGGEQQRVVIARALINNPQIILADEPTGNLDPEASQEILKNLVDISNNGTAVLLATHNYSLLDYFPSRIIKCENGRLIEGNGRPKAAQNVIQQTSQQSNDPDTGQQSIIEQ
ncbi:ATP-binding cassette domain-containing protein [Candidatus Amoebophilus asiaticus]|nr:ATP-binding cassette domain-containing protein [Candidatus Amoebophilus asiaticus]